MAAKASGPADHLHVGVSEEERAFHEAFANNDGQWHVLMRRRLLRKVDWHLLPLLIIMYILNFLDRNNLAQAQLGTIEQDLNMTGADINTATSILFVGYILMQLPSNLIITRVKPAVYIGLVMAAWGLISACQGAAQSYAGLVVARFLLGFVEAPFFCGAIMLMSSWYTRKELAHRIAWFYSGTSLANAFGGLIGAGVLGNLSGARGIAGWRWLFIIEGTITVFFGLIATVILPNYPSTTPWLEPEERAYADWRLLADTGEADISTASSLWTGLKLTFRDRRIYLFLVLIHASLVTQSPQYFFPVIVKTLGYGKIETLLITAPIWIATFLVSLIVTWSSGRTGDRSMHIMVLQTITVVGSIIVVATTSTAARFFALFLLPMGGVAAYQIIVAWVANSFPRPLVKRSACIACANMVGNSSTIYATYMWQARDGPRYIPGGVGTAVVSLLVIVLTWLMRVWLRHTNRKLEALEEVDERGVVVKNGHENWEGARAVGFRYIT